MLSVVRGIWSMSWRGRIGLLLTGILLFAALIGPLLPVPNPNLIDTSATFLGPSWKHPLGTDDLGRDLLSRLLYGSRTSLGIAAGAVALAVLIGHVMGMAAGFVGGGVDLVIGRITARIFARPALLIAIGIIAILGSSRVNTALAIGIGMAPLFVRIVRSAVVQAKAQDFVAHAKALGLPWWRILTKEIWPTIMPTVIVQATVALGFAILDEAGLGFLGLGVQPPDASWGAMFTLGRRFMLTEPGLVLTVGAALAIAVFGLNLLSDGLQEALDPRAAAKKREKKARA
jgi:peptide/nickel transport system permease protein